VRKHRNNPQYFKGKELKSEIFNQINIKKIKLIKIILKKNKKRESTVEKKKKKSNTLLVKKIKKCTKKTKT